MRYANLTLRRFKLNPNPIHKEALMSYQQIKRDIPDRNVEPLFKKRQNLEPTLYDNQLLLHMLSGYYTDARSAGQPRKLDDTMKERYRKLLGTAADEVKVFENPMLNKIGEQGFANGDEIHIANGAFSPHTHEGTALLDHEFSHIKQQSSGMSHRSGLVLDQALESSADHSITVPSLHTTLCDAGHAPIQGRHARSIGTRIKNKFRTWFNIGNYATDKTRGKNTAREKLLELGQSDVDDGGLTSSAFDAKIQHERDSGFASIHRGNEVADSHAQEIMEDAVPERLKNNTHYSRFMSTIHTQLNEFNAAKSAADATPVQKQEKNRNCIKKLRDLELRLYQYQQNSPEAAEDNDFLSLMNRIQKEHQDQTEIMADNGFDFYSGNDAMTEENSLKAQAIWTRLRNVTGEETSGLTIGDKRYNSTLQPDPVNGKYERVDGFKKKTMAQMARILSTDTGVDLLDSLNGVADRRVLVRPAQILADSKERSPGAAVVNRGTSTITAQAGNPSFRFGDGDSSEIGLSSMAENTKDSSQKDKLLQNTDRTKKDGHYVKTGNSVLSPQYVVLAHELTHALHNMHGMNFKGETMSNDDHKHTTWDHMEEMATISGRLDPDATEEYRGNKIGRDILDSDKYRRYIHGINENKMRRELGLIERNAH